jgi:O-6-methylguanine DNA methyltransferase
MTQFQNLVYQAVKNIPKGKTLTYKQVAIKIGRPNSARAVGNALNKNFDRSIPCHRVIRSDGKTGGYNRGVRKKIELLKKEKAI